jgi:hypothetical protein
MEPKPDVTQAVCHDYGIRKMETDICFLPAIRRQPLWNEKKAYISCANTASTFSTVATFIAGLIEHLVGSHSPYLPV